MKKNYLIISLLFVTLLFMTGCDNTVKQVTKKTSVTITSEELKDLEKVSKLVFTLDLDSLTNKDLSEEKKAEIARGLQENYLEVSGSKMTMDFKKFFGEDQTVTFNNIPCGYDHGNEEENIMLIFDKDEDKYVYNEKHPGHGGGGKKYIGAEMELENITVKGNEYYYDVKLFFYGDAGCSDVGACQYGKAYKTYSDAKNKTNPIVEIDNNSDYVTQYSSDELPETHLDKVMTDLKDHLNTYEFMYKKVDGNLVFQNYTKK